MRENKLCEESTCVSRTRDSLPPRKQCYENSEKQQNKPKLETRITCLPFQSFQSWKEHLIMSFSHLPGSLVLSRRLEFILRTPGALNFLQAYPLRRQSTEARASRLETSTSSSPALRNWTKVYPFLPAQSTLMPSSLLEHDRANFQKQQQQSLIAIDEDRQVFMEQYLTHELIMDKERVRSLLFLCEDAINENYPSNEDIIQLCNFLKLFFTANDIYYNPKPFMIPFNVLYNR